MTVRLEQDRLRPVPCEATPKTAFVLSGGASRGSIQVGMLQACYERGVKPDLIVATSAGALNGGFIASRPQTVSTAGELGEIWIELRRGQVFPLNPLTGLLGFAGAREHLVADSGLRHLIERHLPGGRLEDLPIPMHVIATSLDDGKEVRLSSGPLVETILAGAAIPGILPSVRLDGRDLVDGGVANNTPISHAVELGADRIYVLPTGLSGELETAPHGAIGMVVYAINLLMHRRLLDDIDRFRNQAELIVLPPPCPVDVQPMDFSKAEALIARSLEQSRRFLAERQRAQSDGLPLSA